MKLRDILRSQGFDDDDSLLSSSLVSSSDLQGLLASSSGSDSKTRQHTMKFHETWQHSNCPVMKLYRDYQVTTFRTIEHWKRLDGTFFHEFLVLQFTDGSACRVERMGQGSHADAIRRIGCAAYDLIQWFSVEDNQARKWLKDESELIIQVDFPQTFDLLDVLAICYTIQHRSKRASVYTLQRYNCYFLCSAILSILARRVANWERLVADHWENITHMLLGELKSVALTPLAEQDPIDFFAVGICALLDPGSADPACFLMERLQVFLDSNRCLMVECLGKQLWQQQTMSFLFKEMISKHDHNFDVLEDSQAIDRPHPATIPSRSVQNRQRLALHYLLEQEDKERYPSAGFDFDSLDKRVAKEIISSCSTLSVGIVDAFKTLYQLKKAESPPSLSVRVFASLVGPVVMLRPAAGILSRNLLKNDGAVYLRALIDKGSVSVSRVVSAVPWKARLDMLKLVLYGYYDQFNPEGEGAAMEKMISQVFLTYEHAAKTMHLMLLDRIQQGSEDTTISTALCILNRYLAKSSWELSLLICLFKHLRTHIAALMAPRLNKMRTFSSDRTERHISVDELHEHVQKRIDTHARRVESYQLSPAPLVCNDIQKAMTEIWRSLPVGFGSSVIAESESASVHSSEPLADQSSAPKSI